VLKTDEENGDSGFERQANKKYGLIDEDNGASGF
jgi:hypothetical protein